jgi:hypothetical protein
MKIQRTIIIKSGASRVWDVLTDFQNYPYWMGSSEKIAMSSKENIGKDFTYYVIGILGGLKYRTFHKIVEWKEDSKLMIFIKSLYGEGYATYNLNWTPEGCEVNYILDVVLPKKYVKKQELIHKSLSASIEETLFRLKFYIERPQIRK